MTDIKNEDLYGWLAGKPLKSLIHAGIALSDLFTRAGRAEIYEGHLKKQFVAETAHKEAKLVAKFAAQDAKAAAKEVKRMAKEAEREAKLTAKAAQKATPASPTENAKTQILSETAPAVSVP